MAKPMKKIPTVEPPSKRIVTFDKKVPLAHAATFQSPGTETADIMKFITTMKTKTVTNFRKRGGGPKIPIIKTIEEESSAPWMSQLNSSKKVDMNCPNQMLK